MTRGIAEQDSLELLPCPFCGAEPERCQNTDPSLANWMFWVLCKSCHASPGDRKSRAEADAAWNTRPEADALCQMRAALAEVRSMEVRGFPRSEIIDEIDAALTTPKIEKE